MIRIFQRGDHRAVAEIFVRAVHEIASEVYTREECLAWSDVEPNYEHWRKRCELKRPFVAVTDGVVSGFLELDPDGYIDCAYVNPDFARRGVISGLIAHAVETCFAMRVASLRVEASICAKPVFEKAGFRMVREKFADVKGQRLRNYEMVMENPGIAASGA